MRTLVLMGVEANMVAVRYAPDPMFMAPPPHCGRDGATCEPDWKVVKLFWSPDGSQLLLLAGTLMTWLAMGMVKDVTTELPEPHATFHTTAMFVKVNVTAACEPVTVRSNLHSRVKAMKTEVSKRAIEGGIHQ
jgi:hypothetical protein